MAVILQKTFSNVEISLKFLIPNDNKLALVWVMAWGRSGDKPLPDLILTRMLQNFDDLCYNTVEQLHDIQFSCTLSYTTILRSKM